MNYTEVNKILSSKIKNNELIEVFRAEIDEISLLANPIDFSTSLLCFENIVDFIYNNRKLV